MLFNSFDFLVFFLIFYIVFFTSRGRLRLWILLLASCVFYAWFIPKYLLILFATIAIDYFAAMRIEDTDSEKRRKLSLLLGIFNTALILIIFKYQNFFIDNVNWIASSNIPHLDLILPIGLSFHTFQSLSYVIDVYQKKIKAERDLLVYSNYVMMFPQLVAGPIERAGHLIPQIRTALTSRPEIENIVAGMMQFFYGLFKKVVVADSIAPYVDAVYGNQTFHTPTTLFVASLLFAVQIYADFSGYSDMAIGTARTLGIRFYDNFKTPYFSKSVSEFWRRWHTSLSSWIRDYVYFPLARSLGTLSKPKLFSVTLLTFALIGLWHGANWTFIIFGLIQGAYIVLETLLSPYTQKIFTVTKNTLLSKLYSVFSFVYVFLLFAISLVFFRSSTVHEALYILSSFTEGLHIKDISFLDTTGFATIVFSTLLLFVGEALFFNRYSFDELIQKYGKVFPAIIAVSCVLLVLAFGQVDAIGFIYFQF